jgi:hypothetical protein
MDVAVHWAPREEGAAEKRTSNPAVRRAGKVNRFNEFRPVDFCIRFPIFERNLRLKYDLGLLQITESGFRLRCDYPALIIPQPFFLRQEQRPLGRGFFSLNPKRKFKI